MKTLEKRELETLAFQHATTKQESGKFRRLQSGDTLPMVRELQIFLNFAEKHLGYIPEKARIECARDAKLNLENLINQEKINLIANEKMLNDFDERCIKHVEKNLFAEIRLNPLMDMKTFEKAKIPEKLVPLTYCFHDPLTGKTSPSIIKLIHGRIITRGLHDIQHQSEYVKNLIQKLMNTEIKWEYDRAESDKQYAEKRIAADEQTTIEPYRHLRYFTIYARLTMKVK